MKISIAGSLLMMMVCSVILMGSTAVASSSTPKIESCSEQDRESHPVLCSMVDHLSEDRDAVARELHTWAKTHGLLVGAGVGASSPPVVTAVQRNLRQGTSPTSEVDKTDGESSSIPVVFAHGMGDSCFNSGMKDITKRASDLLGGEVYSVCVPTGKTQAEDTTNGYFLSMDASVDVFAETVAQDPKLANGFHAIGFSQGNNVIRGYIAKYNTPTVKTFVSVNGVNGGEGAVPYCQPSLLSSSSDDEMTSSSLEFSMCDLLMEQASRAAYTEYAQGHSFQANYWRDPRPVEFPTYQKMCQLAAWNNEGVNGVNQTLKDNFAKTEQFVWVLATKDGMIWPKEGEQWGAPDPNDPFQSILPREETDWYTKDLFGLRTAEEAGKNVYESFDGDHLQFSMDDFDRWIKTYFA